MQLISFKESECRRKEWSYDYIYERGQNEWQFLFFEMLELESYDDKVKWRMKFLEFLKEDTDKNIVRAPYRNLAFLQKFLDVDPHIYINVSKIILQKKNYNDFMLSIYFGLLFYEREFSCKKNVQISVYEPDRIIFCWNLKIIMRYLTACLKMLQTIFKAIYHAESRF